MNCIVVIHILFYNLNLVICDMPGRLATYDKKDTTYLITVTKETFSSQLPSTLFCLGSLVQQLFPSSERLKDMCVQI